MVAAMKIFSVLCVCLLILSCYVDNSIAHPGGGMFGGGHGHGHGIGIGQLLAAGAVIKLLQQHG
ncbi:hypothetical protein X975_09891, partial [Stegodyphus mimosarum]